MIVSRKSPKKKEKKKHAVSLPSIFLTIRVLQLSPFCRSCQTTFFRFSFFLADTVQQKQNQKYESANKGVHIVQQAWFCVKG
jgi:hypothetical protein